MLEIDSRMQGITLRQGPLSSRGPVSALRIVIVDDLVRYAVRSNIVHA
jgi:hypothetical protein